MPDFSILGQGAIEGLEEFLAKQLFQQELEAKRQERQRAAQMEEARFGFDRERFAADQSDRAADRALREQQMAEARAEREAAKREVSNARGFRSQIGDWLTMRPLESITPEERQTFLGMSVREGVDLPEALTTAPPPPKRTVVTTTGKRGEPIKRAVTEEELETGVPEYREPREPRSRGDRQIYLRNGAPTPLYDDELRRGDIPLPSGGGGGFGAAQERVRNNRAAAALNSIENLKRIAPERVPGLPGIVQGVGQTVAGLAGYNTEARQYKALIQPVAMQMAVAIQGAANLSNTEREAMAQMLGSIHTMDYETQMALLDQAADLIASGADVESQDTPEGRQWRPRQNPLGAGTTVPFPSDRDRRPGASPTAPMQRPIPGIPGAIAESTDGGKTWRRVK